MKSAILMGILSFIVIFIVTCLLTGVFQGIKTAWEMRQQEEEVVEQVEDLSLERKSLLAQTEDISRREGQIADMEEALELEKAVITEEFNKLKAMHKRIKIAVGQVEENKQKSLRKLAKMYEVMPPKDAALILSGMEVGIVLEVIRFMKERPAAKVMAALDPARAAVLSNMMSASKGDK